jgi:predicted RNA binding protein YcfA (HicA-like mRNA interferase family)
MKIPRDLSGLELAAVLIRRWGYAKVNQVGSQIILETHEPRSHRIAVPAHTALRVGTLNSILRTLLTTKASPSKMFLILSGNREED